MNSVFFPAFPQGLSVLTCGAAVEKLLNGGSHNPLAMPVDTKHLVVQHTARGKNVKTIKFLKIFEIFDSVWLLTQNMGFR